ncbi:MAG: GNAT family N-acetyltransferase [Nitrospirota bacterium]|nr:GNAT family N-acetyltransferase [Nitrospirota bacterium]
MNVAGAIRRRITTALQKLLWIDATHNFVVTSLEQTTSLPSGLDFTFIPITQENYGRVKEFREKGRINEYRKKLQKDELGFFAICGARAAGSIWATINTTSEPVIVRRYMRLKPNEALVHDIVTGEHFRGRSIGPFMVNRIIEYLLGAKAVSKVLIDVSMRNRPSLRMMEKAGLTVHESKLYVSAFGKLAFERLL